MTEGDTYHFCAWLLCIFYILSSYTGLMQIRTVTLEAAGKVYALYSHLEEISHKLGTPTLDFICMRNFNHIWAITHFCIVATNNTTLDNIATILNT